MKSYYLLFVLFIFSFSQNIKAQVTYHFLHSGAVWGQFEGAAAFIDGQWGLAGGTFFQSSQGDTTFNAQSYFKIGTSDSLGDPGSYVVSLREDSLGKVWWFDELSGSDKILYDFTLVAGDIITPSSPLLSVSNCSILVDSVSTINLLGNERKAIYFNHTPAGGCGASIDGGYYSGSSLIWIEGIGSNAGLLFPTGGNVIADAALWLTCYRENGQLAFGDVCNISLDVSSPVSFNSSFEISPNPFTTSTTITFTNFTTPFNVQLFDELGKEVPLQYQARQPGSSNILTIDRGELLSGMYFLSIASGEKRRVVKLMVE